MTFLELIKLTGLSHSEMMDYLGVGKEFYLKMRSGKSWPADGMYTELHQLIQAINLVAEGHQIELPYDGAKKEAERIKLRLQYQMEHAKT